MVQIPTPGVQRQGREILSPDLVVESAEADWNLKDVTFEVGVRYRF